MMPASKRKFAEQQQTVGQSWKQAKQDGQTAVSHDLDIPVDEAAPLQGTATVYVDDGGVIFDASLNQTNIGGNNNKFYVIQLLFMGEVANDYVVHTRWGRVGEKGQVKTLGPFDLVTALNEFNKKFRDKSGYPWKQRHNISGAPKKGKYTYLERDYTKDENKDVKDDTTPKPMVKSKLPVKTQQLIELIFNIKHFNSVLEGDTCSASR